MPSFKKDPNWRIRKGALAQATLRFEEDGKADEISIVGEIEAVHRDGTVTVLEGHAFHRMWGGSNGGRGQRHRLPRAEVIQPESANARRIARETVDTYRRNPEKWDAHLR